MNDMSEQNSATHSALRASSRGCANRRRQQLRKDQLDRTRQPAVRTRPEPRDRSLMRDKTRGVAMSLR